MIEQRSKEISIRIVLGASVRSILALLTTNFAALMLISMVLAVPVSVYLMQEWPNEFAYRIAIGWQFLLLLAEPPCLSRWRQ